MDGLYDAYAWDQKKVLKELGKYSDGKVPCIGTHDPTGEALLNFVVVLDTITDPTEKKKFAAMISQAAFDLLLVTTDAEQRLVIEMTPETLKKLHDAGVTSVVDDWCYETEGGYPADDLEMDGGPLEEGSFLVFTQKGFYRIKRDEFLKSHKPGHNN